jgi:hypothetical protein
VIPEAPGLGRPYREGDRVRVTCAEAPPCRSGRIVLLCPERGGVKVFHDEATAMGPVFGNRRIFSWSWNEIEPEAE